MATMNNNSCGNPEEQEDLQNVFKQKRILRTKVHKTLKSMDPSLRSHEDADIKTRKKLYVPLVEDKNSQMRMFHISSTVMQVNEPVDLFLLPGLAFDRSGRRLGCGGGYYDTILKKYQDFAKERNRRQPLLVTLSYSLQIMYEIIPFTPKDKLVDALVCPSGVIPISPAALHRST